MTEFRYIATPRKGREHWYIRRRIQRRASFLGIKFWKTVDTRYFGPYENYIIAYTESGKPFTFKV